MSIGITDIVDTSSVKSVCIELSYR